MRMQRILVALTAVNVVLLVAALAQARSTGAQTIPALLQARALELVNEHGRVRARLYVASHGEAVCRLLDQKGTIRVKLGPAEGGSGLVLTNDATEVGVHG